MPVDIETSCQSVGDYFCEDYRNELYEWAKDNKIEWIHGVNNGVELAESIGRPMMVVIYHKNYPSCQSLFRKLNRSNVLVQIFAQRKLIPVKEELKWMPGDLQRAPKVLGGNSPLYVPRIVFLSGTGKFLPRFKNKRINSKFRYFYEDTDSLMETIASVLKSHHKKVTAEKSLRQVVVDDKPSTFFVWMTASLEKAIFACLFPVLYQEILNVITFNASNLT